jgi:transporter family protein
MAGYSLMTLFVKLAERSGNVSTYMVLAVSTTIIIFAIGVVAWRGELKTLIFELETPPLLWAIASGVALTVAVSSRFHALVLGPANIVVPFYGTFIVGGAVLGVVVLGEAMPWHRVIGLIAAVIGVVLISL